MTTVPGIYFTKEQLEADRKGNNYFNFLHSHSNQANELVYLADEVSVGDCTDSDRLNHFGYVYSNERRQYDKALAWYLLAAMESNSHAHNNIGVLYNHGHGIPQNYLCYLKWYLKCIEQNTNGKTANQIGKLFENGQGVPLYKYKALEWYCHGGDKANINRLKSEGYHRFPTDKSKMNSIIDSLY
jgi:TPR repeat protein